MQGIRSAFDVGRDEFKVTGLVPYFRQVEIKYDQLDATAHTYDIPVQAGTLVLGVVARIDTAFAKGKYYASASLTAGKVTVLIQELQFAETWRSKGDIGQNG